jgi:hypothetical protein
MTNDKEEKAKALAKRIRDLLADAKKKQQAEVLATLYGPSTNEKTRPERS